MINSVCGLNLNLLVVGVLSTLIVLVLEKIYQEWIISGLRGSMWSSIVWLFIMKSTQVKVLLFEDFMYVLSLFLIGWLGIYYILSRLDN